MPLRKRRDKEIPGQFAWRLIEMLESPAYRVLSHSAHRALARIEIELGAHGGHENGKLVVTFENFVDYGIHHHSVGPAIREVVALGFVEITQRGQAGNADARQPNKFRLTYRFTDENRLTDEWRRFRTTEEAEAVADAARKNKKPMPVSAKSRCRNPAVKARIPNAGIRQYGPMPESGMTLDISAAVLDPSSSNQKKPASAASQKIDSSGERSEPRVLADCPPSKPVDKPRRDPFPVTGPRSTADAVRLRKARLPNATHAQRQASAAEWRPKLVIADPTRKWRRPPRTGDERAQWLIDKGYAVPDDNYPGYRMLRDGERSALAASS